MAALPAQWRPAPDHRIVVPAAAASLLIPSELDLEAAPRDTIPSPPNDAAAEACMAAFHAALGVPVTWDEVPEAERAAWRAGAAAAADVEVSRAGGRGGGAGAELPLIAPSMGPTEHGPRRLRRPGEDPMSTPYSHSDQLAELRARVGALEAGAGLAKDRDEWRSAADAWNQKCIDVSREADAQRARADAAEATLKNWQLVSSEALAERTSELSAFRLRVARAIGRVYEADGHNDHPADDDTIVEGIEAACAERDQARAERDAAQVVANETLDRATRYSGDLDAARARVAELEAHDTYLAEHYRKLDSRNVFCEQQWLDIRAALTALRDDVRDHWDKRYPQPIDPGILTSRLTAILAGNAPAGVGETEPSSWRDPLEQWQDAPAVAGLSNVTIGGPKPLTAEDVQVATEDVQVATEDVQVATDMMCAPAVVDRFASVEAEYRAHAAGPRGTCVPGIHGYHCARGTTGCEVDHAPEVDAPAVVEAAPVPDRDLERRLDGIIARPLDERPRYPLVDARAVAALAYVHAELADDVALIVQHTECPDPGYGGCIGGPIPGRGCVNELARGIERRLRALAKDAAPPPPVEGGGR